MPPIKFRERLTKSMISIALSAILLYADDGALLCVSELGLQIRMHKPNQCANKWRLGIISPPKTHAFQIPKQSKISLNMILVISTLVFG